MGTRQKKPSKGGAEAEAWWVQVQVQVQVRVRELVRV
jgi:hypothetical protein